MLHQCVRRRTPDHSRSRLPYEMDVHAAVNPSNSSVTLTFLNTGRATVVFQVRSGNAADPVRTYTVEPGKSLAGVWNVGSSYDLSIYGPNGFARYFKGSIGSSAAVLDVSSSYGINGGGLIGWKIINTASSQAQISIVDAYSGQATTRVLPQNQAYTDKLSAYQFHGWYDLIITVAGDPTLKYRLAGHIETGADSFSDPALGGVVTLKG